jgi:hypothetical protein
MVNVRTLFALGVALTLVGGAQAAVLFESDLTKGDLKGLKVPADTTTKIAKTEEQSRNQFLSLTANNGNETGVAWTELAQQVPSFTYIADVRIRYASKDSEGNDVNVCPADGFAMSYALVSDPDTMKGGGGGSLGLFGGDVETFTAFEINTWRGQGNGTEEERNSDAGCAETAKHVTFAFDVINPNVENTGRGVFDDERGTPEKGGAKIGQVNPPAGMKIINGGWYRYQWDVLADGTMRVHVTGLEDANKQFAKVKVLETKFPNANHINFAGRWGLHAATGGAVQSTDIAYMRIESPSIPAQ